ncbi:MAG: T9SS type A sorting domain-containing protein, partial [candidate division Zixibacteria bacterium]|nr:T9SS type A sorting domain-containing protein [candidate division Zixibacteria bacterium]
PPELYVPPDFIAYLDAPGQICFGVDVYDEDDNLSGVTVSSPATYNAATSEVCFYADTAGVYYLEIVAFDDCPDKASTLKTVCVTVVIDECLHVQLEKTHGAFQGQVETVNLFLNGTGKPLGGFDLLIAYDQSALTVVAVNPGGLFESCGWEYFNYRFGADGNCSGCPSGLLRIMGIAETNNGAYHPGCFFEGMFGSLAEISFLVSNDRTLQCQYVPIQFFWTDCGDNSFSGQVGDTLWISREVYGFEGASMTDHLWGFPGYFGAPDSCVKDVGPNKPAAQRCVDFTNGGIDIICADSIDSRGDINLNEVAYEIADAVLYSNYFIYGLGVFTVNLEGQIAASDINADGLTLSVADLVYLVRVVVGDAPATPKMVPGTTAEVELAMVNNVLTIAQADAPVGAISLVLEGETEPELHPAAEGMELRYAFDGTNTRVLIYNLDGESYLQTGEVLKINGNHAIKEIDIGGYDGFVMGAKLNTLPDCFSLSQNYPNPFNPTTLIEFGLPVASEWELVIYNVLGQVVQIFNDNSEAGYIKVEWDASQYASGVYFYRLVAGEFSSTKKMVLLK